MPYTRIVIISGPPGAGKSSVTRISAENSTHGRTVHIHTDDFYGYIRKGYIEPWQPASNEQNTVIAEAVAACAKSFADGGYEVFIDGVVGPWHLGPWLKAARDGKEVHYAILRPGLKATVSRAVNRKGAGDLVDSAVVMKMWEDFAGLGIYESHVIDTTNQTVEESAVKLKNMLDGGYLRI